MLAPRTDVKAGTIYFAIVFAVAFVLGIVRTLVLAPRLGAVAAVAIEVPILLILSWFVCRHCVSRFRVPWALADRFIMGMVAFALLMGAELLLSLLLTDRSAAQFFSALAQREQLLGFAGQIAFALMPVIQALLPPRGQLSR